MRTIRLVALGLLALSAALCLTGCKSGRLVTRTEVVEVPRRQYVALPTELTADVPEPAKPAPECVVDGKPVLCNRQLLDWIDALRAAFGLQNDARREIRELQAEAMSHDGR